MAPLMDSAFWFPILGVTCTALMGIVLGWVLYQWKG